MNGYRMDHDMARSICYLAKEEFPEYLSRDSANEKLSKLTPAEKKLIIKAIEIFDRENNIQPQSMTDKSVTEAYKSLKEKMQKIKEGKTSPRKLGSPFHTDKKVLQAIKKLKGINFTSPEMRRKQEF